MKFTLDLKLLHFVLLLFSCDKFQFLAKISFKVGNTGTDCYWVNWQFWVTKTIIHSSCYEVGYKLLLTWIQGELFRNFKVTLTPPYWEKQRDNLVFKNSKIAVRKDEKLSKRGSILFHVNDIVKREIFNFHHHDPTTKSTVLIYLRPTTFLCHFKTNFLGFKSTHFPP